MSALELADISNVSAGTIRNLERSDEAIKKASLDTVSKIKAALEKKGIKFLNPSEQEDGSLSGYGVRYFPKSKD